MARQSGITPRGLRSSAAALVAMAGGTTGILAGLGLVFAREGDIPLAAGTWALGLVAAGAILLAAQQAEALATVLELRTQSYTKVIAALDERVARLEATLESLQRERDAESSRRDVTSLPPEHEQHEQHELVS